MKLLAGNSNRTLAEAIADHLDTPLTKAQVRRFADNEVFVAIDENVRGEDVFVIQSTSYPANDNLMELLICIDALSRASAKVRLELPASSFIRASVLFARLVEHQAVELNRPFFRSFPRSREFSSSQLGDRWTGLNPRFRGDERVTG